MSASLDLTTDLANVADGLQAVTLRRPGSMAQTAVAHALRRALTVAEAQASGGKCTAADVVWHLPSDEVPEPPRAGDLVIDAAGQRWTVLEVQVATLGARWKCTTRQLGIAAGLDAFVTIQKAEYVKGQAGAVEPHWVDLYAGLAARIQPAAVDAQTAHGAHATLRRFDVFVADDVAVDASCRVIGPDGAAYRVIGVRRPERIDELLVVEVVA